MALQNNITENLIDLGSIREDAELEIVLRKISRIKSLAQPPILFPDLTYKPLTEAPSSLATVTKGAIIPTLTAPSLGSSMGVIKTGLKKEEITLDALKSFYGYLEKNGGFKTTSIENILIWLGLKKRNRGKYDLTDQDLKNVLLHGATAAVDIYDLPKETLSAVEDGGSVLTEKEKETLNLKELLPRICFTNGKHNLGYGFKRNRFVEFQIVENILDKKVAQSLELEEDDVVIMYHGGGGLIPHYVGRYYARRKKSTPKQSFFLLIGKVLFHLLSLKGLRYFVKRLRYYFFPKIYQEISLDSYEGKKVLYADKLALNYSYAWNIALVRRVSDALENTFSETEVSPKLIVAGVHNSIEETKINGEEAILHRHTVNKVHEGKITTISGMNNISSCIVIGESSASKYLYSSDHGAGSIIQKLKDMKKLESRSEYKTHIFNPRYEKSTTHNSTKPIKQLVENLTKKKIIRPVLYMRPIASFKG